ncbi:MAG: hypothetical protein HC897_01335 [Thermoanaerobaculia bacterium]|nr:hypothetical protein [Thermoanaerobaculia bacterium]
MTLKPTRLLSVRFPHFMAVMLLTTSPVWAACTNPPVAVGDQVELVDSVAVVDVLANDTLPDGRSVGVQVLNGSCLALGTTQVLGGVVTYRANPGPVAACSFGYRVTDETGLASDATVSVTVPVSIFADGFEAGNLLAWSDASP